jgi:uncharacterized protein YfdQ (DUF2303 family)
MSLQNEGDPEAAVVRDLAIDSTKPEALNPELHYYVTRSQGSSGEVLDLERFLDAPRRKRGTTELADQESFTRFVKIHTGGDEVSLLYADKKGYAITAVLNDAGADPAWRDHRAHLALRHTRQWLHWTKRDNQLLSQVEFAEHVEDGLEEIVDPPAAVMYELAQSFHAHTKVKFQDATVLNSGERQFAYIEETQATAGKRGDIKVPATFDLGIAPFEGTQPYKIKARLRYRLTDGGLKIGYKLIGPEDVADAAFADSVEWIESDTDRKVLYGTP